MPNLTLSIPEETKKRMTQHPHVRWSNVVRTIIEQKLDDFEVAERLAKKGSLKLSDFEDIRKKVADSSRKHAERLLHESHR